MNYEGYYEIEGCVVEEVDVRADKVKYVLEVSKILIDNEWKSVKGRILVNGSRYPVYNYGDCLSVTGKVQRPEKVEDFAYDKYLSR